MNCYKSKGSILCVEIAFYNYLVPNNIPLTKVANLKATLFLECEVQLSKLIFLIHKDFIVKNLICLLIYKYSIN